MKSILSSVAAATICIASVSAQAQVMRPVLDFATADAMRKHCLAHARKTGYAVAVAVFDHGGELISFANDGASPSSSALAKWKGRSAAIYRHSTAQTATWNVPTAPSISTVEGGVPLFTREGIGIGGIGVSGAPSTFDAECATRAAEAAKLRVAPTGEP